MKIYKLGELPESMYKSVGGKARGLDFLKRNDFKIARGFVICDILELKEEDKKDIFDHFDDLDTECVSVRSSASNEDGKDLSSAGQYETYLFVKKDKLIESVQKCLDSLNNERAKKYNENFSQEESKRMNIVVEKMVDSRVAGVMFSLDPTNSNNVLIESVDGQGENLVSGSQNSYHYSIPKSEFSNSLEGNLKEEELKTLYEQGLKIKELFGDEVDLEWAISKSNKLYWLQLRPITTLEESPINEFNTTNSLKNHLVTTRNIGEMMPGAITPLSISTSVLAIDYGMRNMFKRAGAIKKVGDLPDYNMAFSYDYHLFIDMTALHYLSHKVALASPSAMNLSIMGDDTIKSPELEGKKSNIFTGGINSIKFMKYVFSTKKAKREALRLANELTFKKSDDIKEIYQEITNKLHYLNDVLSCHYVCSSYSGTMNSTLYMTASSSFKSKEEYQDFISQILSDIDGIESADILAKLRVLANKLNEIDPSLQNLSEEELLEFINKDKESEIYKFYQEFLKKHGHRSIKEAEMRSLSWKNDQISLMRNLKTVMSSKEQTKEKKEFNIDDYLKDFKKSQRSTLKWAGTKARQGVQDREYSKSLIIRVIDKFKDQYRKLASLMKKEELLFDEDSIYFLSHEEIGRLINREMALKRKAISRRKTFNEAQEISFDDVIYGEPKPQEVGAINEEQALKGIPVCRGKVYGKARIVKNQEDAQRLVKGEIMVAPFTDIGWSPYYSIISCLITEVGSSLSHGAVVAREYSLPTIVNAKNATKIIKNGDYLHVDASKGLIEIISEEEAKKHFELA